MFARTRTVRLPVAQREDVSEEGACPVCSSVMPDGQRRHSLRGRSFVRNGRIDKIVPGISAHADDVDAAAATRMIDDQVRIEPGLTHKGCIASESAAAAAGGITSFMDAQHPPKHAPGRCPRVGSRRRRSPPGHPWPTMPSTSGLPATTTCL